MGWGGAGWGGAGWGGAGRGGAVRGGAGRGRAAVSTTRHATGEFTRADGTYMELLCMALNVSPEHKLPT